MLITTASLALFGASAASANCGVGTIQEVQVGAWNTDSFVIKVEFEVGQEPANVFPAAWAIEDGYIRFALDLSSDRMAALQAAAMLAMANGSRIKAYSHRVNAQNEPDCSNATQLSLFSTLSS